MQNATKTLVSLLAAHFGEDRRIVLARELTKMFETFLSGSIKDIFQCLENDKNQSHGEMVILIEGKLASEEDQHPQIINMLSELLEVLPLKKAVTLTEKLTGARKNFLYKQALLLQKK